MPLPRPEGMENPMRYLPVVDVWNPAVHAALATGQLRLQCGQWITCGPDAGYKSRFHHAHKGYICAFHGPQASKQFRSYASGQKEGQRRLAAARSARAAAMEARA